jgi:hypothetical protein
MTVNYGEASNDQPVHIDAILQEVKGSLEKA